MKDAHISSNELQIIAHFFHSHNFSHGDGDGEGKSKIKLEHLDYHDVI